jgi:HPt (histidine-containing phosphotransfer) domain-containing protein
VRPDGPLPETTMTLDRTTYESIQEIDPDGSLGLFKDVVSLFTRSIPTELARLDKYHKANLSDDLARSAHRFKSSCQTIGATEIAKLLNQLEVEKNSLTYENRESILVKINALAHAATRELQDLMMT